MAGIGFRLQALITRGSYLEAATAYLSSVVITSGPWLAGVVALTVINTTTFTYLSVSDHALLSATMVFLFAVSLLIAGGPQLTITRYLADLIYVKQYDMIAPTCTGMIFLFVPLAVISLPFILFAPFDLRYRLMVYTLFMTLTMIWLVMMFLSAAQEHLRILAIFVVSYALSVGAALLLGYHDGLIGCLAGFTLGQVMCLSLLVVSIYREFPSDRRINFAYLGYLRKYWILTLIGALYALSIWADSLLFWFSSQGHVIAGFYHLSPAHDAAKFLMYLSTIPAAVAFMIHLETNFYRYYYDYYYFVRHKGTLTSLVKAREGMLSAIRTGWVQLLKVQALVAIFLCLIADNLAAWIGLSPHWVPLLRIEMLASIGQFEVFAALLLLLYIDQRRSALLLVSTTVVSIILLTLLTLYLGERFYGLGYLVATLMGAILGWFMLNNRLKRLEYLTFMTQPMG